MRKLVSFVVIPVLFAALAQGCDKSTNPQDPEKAVSTRPALSKQTGFDEFGYNYNARVFNGPADGVDRVLDGKVWGDPTYANDHLKMKWNAEWDRGNDEGWLLWCVDRQSVERQGAGRQRRSVALQDKMGRKVRFDRHSFARRRVLYLGSI